MQYQSLPQLNEKVSKICLGTMTWAQQNTEDQAHTQMDMALSEGCKQLNKTYTNLPIYYYNR